MSVSTPSVALDTIQRRQEHQHRLDNPEGDGAAAECVQARPVGVGDRPVDDRPGDQRDDDRRRRCPAAAKTTIADEAGAVRAQVAAEAATARRCAARASPCRSAAACAAAEPAARSSASAGRSVWSARSSGAAGSLSVRRAGRRSVGTSTSYGRHGKRHSRSCAVGCASVASTEHCRCRRDLSRAVRSGQSPLGDFVTDGRRAC